MTVVVGRSNLLARFITVRVVIESEKIKDPGQRTMMKMMKFQPLVGRFELRDATLQPPQSLQSLHDPRSQLDINKNLGLFS